MGPLDSCPTWACWRPPETKANVGSWYAASVNTQFWSLFGLLCDKNNGNCGSIQKVNRFRAGPNHLEYPRWLERYHVHSCLVRKGRLYSNRCDAKFGFGMDFAPELPVDSQIIYKKDQSCPPKKVV